MYRTKLSRIPTAPRGNRDEVAAKSYGHRWFVERRSALLLVQSLPARIEKNILINPDHPDAGLISHSLHEPVWWDTRLFAA